MVDTLKTVIKSCVLDPIDVDTFAMFDLEYIFTQLRAKSVGETVELLMSCDEDHGEENKLAKVKMSIDLTKIESFYKNGILSINLPKRKEFHSQVRKIISVKK